MIWRHSERPSLAPFRKEVFKQIARRRFAQPAIYIGCMVAGGLLENTRAMIDATPFGVIGPEVQSADSCERDCRGAHGAGLQRHVEITTVQPWRAGQLGRFADYQHFGMGRGIVQFFHLVSRCGQNRPASGIHQHGAHGHFAPRGGGAGLLHSLRHEADLDGICKRHVFSYHVARPHAIRTMTSPRRPVINRHRMTGTTGMAKTSSQNQDETPQKGERIAKVMARAGLCSRREAERWIADGRVVVDGAKLTSPALTVTQENTVVVDGKPLVGNEETKVWRYHKPAGLIVSHSDPEGRATIFERLPKNLPRVISVGRLDLNSEGLMLLTNNGELARHMEKPDTGWIRRYRVRVNGRVDEAALAKLANGVTISGIRYGAIKAEMDRQKGANAWVTMALTEGKNREIRKVMEHLGYQVTRLIRTAYGPFQLGNMERGAVADVSRKMLRESVPNSFKLD